jgi:uncharacterized protein (DUF1697 family)
VVERRWVAFLRGMNLGGRRLTNEELIAAVRSCGCDDVDAYQASGNVVCADDRGADELTEALQAGLADELGYDVPVFLRGAEEVRAIASATPFAEAQLAGRGKPQVIFLVAAPPQDVLERVEALVPEGDALVPAGRQLHWLPAGGVGRSTMDFRRLDDLTGGTTVRTHGTVQRLASRYL